MKKEKIQLPKIPPRNFLVPLLHFRKGGAYIDRKKEINRRICRLSKWVLKRMITSQG